MLPFVPDPQQQAAIEHVAGPVLVVAGAGTGKTTVLTRRVAHLLSGGHARPEEVLAVTYTRKAAAELRRRLTELSVDIAGLRACNFHQYCYKLLQRQSADFDILTREDLWIYLRQRFEQLPLERFVEARRPEVFLEPLLKFFDRCNDELVAAADYAAYVERVARGELPLPRVGKSKDAEEVTRDEVIARCREIAAVFAWVEAALAREGLGTFGTMITKAVALLKSDPGLLALEQKHARFLLIDEFQDCNIAQIELASLLAGEEQNLFAVGDPDQAIYRFRGASNAAFDEFLRRYPQAKTVVLDLNRRSLPPVLACASAVIAQNPPIVSGKTEGEFARRPLVSWRARQGIDFEPAKVAIVLARNTADATFAENEAAELAETIRETQAATGCTWRDFAVLYRAHGHRNEIAAELAARGIPAYVTGVDALATPEVRDLLAVLKAVELRDPLAIFRVAALPQFKIDPAALAEELESHGDKVDMVGALGRVPGGAAVLAALEDAVRATRGLSATAAVNLSLRQFEFRADAAPIAAFCDFAARWQRRRIAGDGHLPSFLDYLQYLPDANAGIPIGRRNEFEEDEEVPIPLPETDAVRLMTVHAAKGMEFPQVFVLRVQSGSFPTSYHEPLFEFPQELRRELTKLTGDPKEVHIEEERRLFYVAMTRARDTLTLCAKPYNAKDEKPAKFLRELMETKAVAAEWVRRDARPYRVELRAAAAPAPVNVGAWMLRPPRAPLAGEALSASSIDTYEDCPLKFKLSREWNLPGEVAAPMVFGNVVHTVLKAWFDAVRAGRPMAIEAALELFRSGMAEAPFDREIQRQLYLREGVAQLTAFLEARLREPRPEILSTEGGFRVKIGGVPVQGRIDRLDRIEGGRVTIIDYKTGRPREQKDADKSLQLSIYALAAREKWKFVPEKLVLYNLTSNEAVETTRDEEQLAEAVERIVQAAAGIAEGNFEATPGYHCRWCDFASLCPFTEQRLYDISQASTGVI
jgi:DNA helicase-2/ATP-dependent DNA helicase PcrA